MAGVIGMVSIMPRFDTSNDSSRDIDKSSDNLISGFASRNVLCREFFWSHRDLISNHLQLRLKYEEMCGTIPKPEPINIYCGNNIVEGTEDCDGSNLNGQTCILQGFNGGTLSCDPNCMFNTSSCTTCGNNICEPGEATYCPPCTNFNPPCLAPCYLGTCPQECNNSANVNKPIGILNANINSTGMVSGWSLDPDTPNKSIDVHFYIDGPAGKGTFTGWSKAYWPLTGVNQLTGYPGNHGFYFWIPIFFRDNQQHTIYAYGIDSSGVGSQNALLLGSPQKFTLSPVSGNHTLGNNTFNNLINVQAFSMLDNWDIDIAFEAGAVKEWDCNGSILLNQAINAINNVESTGSQVKYIALDEPYIGGQHIINGLTCALSMQQIASLTANYIQSINNQYPNIIIGDIEPYPRFSVDQIKDWIQELENNGVNLAFFHLDVDLNRVLIEGHNVENDLQELKVFFQSKGIPFGVISNVDTNQGEKDFDQVYYNTVMDWIQTINSAIGLPDQFIFQSWLLSSFGTKVVPINLPENDLNIFSHTRLINDGLSVFNWVPSPNNKIWFTPNVGSIDLLDLFTEPGEWPISRDKVDIFKFYSQQLLDQSTTSTGLEKLAVSSNGRFLIEETSGDPFFYLADTGWALLNPPDVTLAEADIYLEDRKDKKFTVIQSIAIPSHMSLADMSDPNAVRWQNMDYIVNKAESLGMYMAIVPFWGGPLVNPSFTVQLADAYGQFLGSRYRNNSIIWLIGGDTDPTGYEAIWRALAKGIAIGKSGTEDYSKVMMTFHPRGGWPPWFHNEPWLDFNMVNPAHTRNDPRWHTLVERKYNLTPVKPAITGEVGYENIPSGLMRGAPLLNDWDVRKGAYWSLFAGAFGHAYGANEVYMFWDPGENLWGAQIWGANTSWQQALNFPGAYDMQHIRTLIESRPHLIRIPDQTIITSGEGVGNAHVQATRGSDGSYAFVYISDGHTILVDLSKISGSLVKAWWYDPRLGISSLIGQFSNIGVRQFTPASSGAGQDWILVLDDTSKGFPGPGTVRYSGSFQ